MLAHSQAELIQTSGYLKDIKGFTRYFFVYSFHNYAELYLTVAVNKSDVPLSNRHAGKATVFINNAKACLSINNILTPSTNLLKIKSLYAALNRKINIK